MNLVALSEAASIIMGQSPPSSTYNTKGEGLPFFQGKADFGDLYPTARVFCTAPQRAAEPDDILISVRAPVGPTNLNSHKSCIGRGLAAIRPLAHTDTKYLLYFLRYHEPELAKAGTGSTFEAVSRDDIESIKVPHPPLPEQQRIAAILERADRLRRLRRYALALSAGYLQAVFVEMFGDPVRNPKGWEIVRFDQVCESRLGKMLDAKQQTGRHTRPYLRNVNIQWGKIDLSDVQEMDFAPDERAMFRLRKGDVLICEGGEVGRTAIWNDELPECYYQKALHRARPRPGLALPEFILWLMRCLAESGGLGDFTSQVTIAHLTGEKLKTLEFALPPLSLQEEFAHIAQKHERLRAQQREALRQAEQLFGALLDRAFRGEL